MSRFAHIPLNTAGRDYAVGDIHGHFSRLQAALDRIGFDPRRDRLFSVGDLVDRGPQNEQALKWLGQPWFFAVQGNHEALAIKLCEGGTLDLTMYRNCGGGWFLDSSAEKKRLFASAFRRMPLALEVQTADGLVGLVHADCPFGSWNTLRDYLEDRLPAEPRVEEICQWSRTRLRTRNVLGVDGVRAVLVGHTPLREPETLGNVMHIDTAGWSEGFFTLVDLQTLQYLNVPPPKAPLG